jgi:hypothetical protein
VGCQHEIQIFEVIPQESLQENTQLQFFLVALVKNNKLQEETLMKLED